MKESTAIIRINKIQQTKKVLEEAGYPSFTVQKVFGRGKQKGLFNEYSHPVPRPEQGKMEGMRFIPKRMLTIVVEDDVYEGLVDLIIKVNQTGEIGDGKIFISPVKESVRIRTGEKGIGAIY